MTGVQTNAFRTRLDGTVENLGIPEAQSTATKMNAAGELSGVESLSQPGAGLQAIRFTASGVRESLGTFGGWSTAWSINSSGVAVGYGMDENGVAQAFQARPGSPMEPLPGWVPGSWGTAADINDAGVIVGGMGFRAFVYVP